MRRDVTSHAMALEDLLHPYLGRYLGAPSWLKASAGRAYSLIPPRVRLGRTYQHFRGEIARSETARSNEMLVLSKLDATLRWAFDTVPAYQAFRGLLDGGRDARDVLQMLPV